MGRHPDTPRPPAENFYRHVTIDDAAVCWPWRGALNSDGYGVFGHKHGAHKFSYEMNVGPVPKGMHLDHVKARGCTMRHCVNPSHMEPVPCQVNLLRGDTQAAKNAAKTHCPKGHPYADHLTTGRYPQRQCLPCAVESNRKSRARRATSRPGVVP